MEKLNIFLDSSALMAGVISKTGAAYVLLELGEQEEIKLTVSEMVIVESERSIKKKSPGNLNDLRRTSNPTVLRKGQESAEEI